MQGGDADRREVGSSKNFGTRCALRLCLGEMVVQLTYIAEQEKAGAFARKAAGSMEVTFGS